MEFFDVLDCTGKKTGEVISRDDAHKSGAWHGAFHGLIIYKREGRAYALFQKRSVSKKIAPNRFDVSVGGHYAAGEEAAIAGPREIAEELGINVKFEELVPLGRRVFVYCFTPGVMEYEFQDVFLLPKQVRPDDCVLQPEEVDGLLEMDVEQGVRLLSGEIQSLECDFFQHGSSISRKTISLEQFVPCLDRYYLKLLLLSRRYLSGERRLLFI